MKSCLEDLAIFGGDATLNEKLHVGRPNIGKKEQFLERVNDLLDRRWLSNGGPYVQEFEQRVADMLGVKHCIAMCNGTVALEITIRAASLSGEVIVPSFTFVATAHALQWQEITPVFCDIDPQTHTLDPKRIEELITPKTSGIIGVHTWGQPCQVEAIAEIAARRKLKLLFDAAHAFSCSHQDTMIGNFGLAEIFSFHATKFFNTFEGGAVVTNDDALAKKIRLMKNFGFAGYDEVTYIGTNGKMNEIAAAMGLTGLDSLTEFIAANHRNFRAYQQGLSSLPGVSLLNFNEDELCNYQYIVVEIDQDLAGISRDRLIEILHQENILARRYFYPGCHNMEPYRSYFPQAGLVLPETNKLAQRVLLLPTGTSVGTNEIQAICEIIRFIITNNYQIQERLDWVSKEETLVR